MSRTNNLSWNLRVTQIAPIYGPMPGFPPGSWWGIRMDLSRDQVHRPFDKSVDEGSPGASSICTPHSNPCNDLDLGDYLTFTTPSPPSSVTTSHPLVRSCENQIPVRVVRGYNLTNRFSPKTGYRYDGLYVVVSFWLVGDESKKNLRFALVRLNCQGAPPWESPRISHTKKTRNKTRATQRCHMDCCKSRSLMKERGEETLNKPPLKESTIVMRHVSRKSECAPGIESPKLNSTSEAPCKLQNTNISIRTDLYDSSPNPHDVKKTPMTFCRIYKSTKSVKGLSTGAGVLNLNTFGPGAKDRVQESQIQMRSGLGKHSPVLSTSSTGEGSHEILGTESREKIEGATTQEKVSECRETSEELLSKKTKEVPEELESMMGSILLVPKATENTAATGAEDLEAKPKRKTHRTLYSLRSTSRGKEQTDVKASLKRSVLPKAKVEIRKETGHKGKSTKASVQGFSKASKKRQSELAKLVIDAKFVAKSRGPRTRRFPYVMRGFSKRRDNLRHLRGRPKPDISKKTKLIKRSNASEGKPSRIPQSRSLTGKTAEKMEKVREMKASRGLEKGAREKLPREKSTQKKEGTRLKMVDAVVQCSLQRDASTSTSVDFEELAEDRGVRNKWGSLEDFKSETSDDDLLEIVHRNISVQTTQEGEILRPNCVRRSLEASVRLGGGLSAFVPVNMSDVDFRVARLRSIGFKPIHPCVISGFKSQAFCEYKQGSSKDSGTSVVRRDVNEQYKKYTTEENNIVGYMDDELRYQDIEEENSPAKILGKGKRGRKRKSEEIGEGPWHGWKKICTTIIRG
ncbi:uncharacterized protein LOC135162368 isoform X2 [Diachasmimorpha longicaudata]|uniref:uncharacterized protein LOC135162368 isoform X2 n=1 Tax=Diachasmimorpha longicaudata TaxID=58733 RepID=UPI0030B892BA